MNNTKKDKWDKYPEIIQKRLEDVSVRRKALEWPPATYEDGLNLMFFLMGGFPAWRITHPELAPANAGEEMPLSQAEASVILGHNDRSRKLGELIRIIPKAHRDNILGATGSGASLCAILEYVVRYGEWLQAERTTAEQPSPNPQLL